MDRGKRLCAQKDKTLMCYSVGTCSHGKTVEE